MAGRPVGTIFAEVDLSFEPYTRAQKTLLKDATSTTTNIEKNFKNLGIKSAAEFDLMRAKISNSYNMITHSGKASADDILRAEKAKNDQLNRINDQQFGHQTSLIENIKKNWLAYSAGIVATFYAINKAVDFIGTLTTAASDLQETQSKSNAVFGASAAAITAWSKNSAAAFGMSRQAALESASSIGNMFKQLGAGETEAAKTSKSMVELSADLASFHNTAGGATEVLNAMQSAFRGQYEPIQRYIPTINAAAVEQMALATTGKAATSELTRLEKAAAAQAIIMRDAGDAVGDFAKTSGGLANQQRILEANVTDLKAAIGESLLPVAEKIVKEMNNWVGANKDLIGQKVGDTIDGITRAVSFTADAYTKASNALLAWRLLMNMPLPGDYERVMKLAGVQAPVTTGKIGSQTPGWETYANRPTAPPPGPPPPEANKSDVWLRTYLDSTQKAIEADRLRGQSIGEVAVLQNKYETENYQSTVEHGDAWLKKWLSVVDTRTESNRLMNENIGKLAVLDVEDNKKLASEKAQAYGKMYSGMKGDAAKYYDFQLDALDDQRAEYEKLVGKNAVTDAWYARQKKKLDDDLTRSSDDFFGGIKLGYEKSQENAYTFARAGEDTFSAFSASASSSLASFMNPLKEDFLSLPSLVDGVMNSVVDTMTQAAAKIVTQWAIAKATKLIGDIFFHEGAWNIKEDEQAAILQRGEMVINKDTAGSIRGAFGSEAGFESFVNSYNTTAGGSMSPAQRAGFASFGKSMTVNAAAIGAQVINDPSLFGAGVNALAMSMPTAGLGGLTVGLERALGFNIGLDMPSKIGAQLATAIGGMFGGPVGAAIAHFGATLGLDALADMMNSRPNEMTRDYLESQYGYFGGRSRYGNIPSYTDYEWGGYYGGGDGGGGYEGPGTESAGSGMSGMTARGGWWEGPQSGYKANLHGKELVLNQDQVKAVRELNAGGGKGGVTHVHLNLDGREVGYAIIKDGAVIEQIDYKLNKLSKRVYQ